LGGAFNHELNINKFNDFHNIFHKHQHCFFYFYFYYYYYEYQYELKHCDYHQFYFDFRTNFHCCPFV
jgi:hypothetical protein